MKRPQNIYTATLGVWLVGVLIHLVCYVTQMREQLPTEEVYTRALSFQMAAFAFIYMPYWLGCLLIALALEFLIFGRIKKNES